MADASRRVRYASGEAASRRHWGALFIKRIDNVVEKLGTHYGGPAKYKQKDGVYGDPKAFLQFLAEMQALMPKPATAVTL